MLPPGGLPGREILARAVANLSYLLERSLSCICAVRGIVFYSTERILSQVGDAGCYVHFRRNNKHTIAEPFGGYFDGGCVYHFDPHPIWPGVCTRRLLVEHLSCPYSGDFSKTWPQFTSENSDPPVGFQPGMLRRFHLDDVPAIPAGSKAESA